MSCLHHFVALLPLVAWSEAGQLQAEVHQEQHRRFVVIERPGRPPVVILGSDEVLAREDLVGTWQAVSLEHEGEPRPDVARDLQMRFSRGRLELMQQGRPPIVVAYSLETKQYPRHFGWTLRADGCLRMQKGVLWHEGDTLMLCLGPVNKGRTTEFLTQPGDGRTMFVLERVEPRGDDPCNPVSDGLLMGCFRTIVDDLRSCWRDLLVFEVLFKILQTAVLTPLLAWMSATLIHSTGRLAITNTEIASFLLSPAGLAMLFFGAVFGVTSMYVEQAGITILAMERIAGGRMSGTTALMGSVRSIPRLLMLGVRQIGILLLWLGPLAAAGAGACWLLLSGHDINYYLAQRPPEFLWAITIVLLLAVPVVLVLAWFLIRWVFAVPEVLFGGKRPGEALRRSARMVRGAYVKIGGTVLACLGVMVLLPGVLTWLVNLLGLAAFAVVGENLQLAILAAGAILVLHWLVLAAASTVSLSAYVLIVTRLWARMAGWESVLQVLAEVEPAEGRATGVRPRRPARILVAAVATLVVASGVGTYLIAEQLDFQHAVEITAHRGHSTVAPENTLSAIRKAIEAGVDYAEIDVQLTADKVVVVVHDTDLMRIAGDGRRISETSYADLEAVDVGSWFSPEFAGERIPSLDEAIAEARGRVRLNIELKPKGKDRTLARKVVETIRRERFASQCVITSLDYGELLEVKRLAPELRTGFIVARAAGRIFDLEADFLSVNAAMVDSELMTAARRARKDVHTWTVDDPRQMSAMIDRGVKNIITDQVDALVALRKELSQLSDGERIILAFRNWMRP